MTLFEMNQEQERLMNLLCDPETGEIDEEAYDALQQLDIDREEKIDGWCFYLKERKAELEAAKQLLDNAKAKYEAMENNLRRLRARFEVLMDGEKHKSAYNSVSYRTTEAVELDDGVDVRDIDDDYLKYREPELDKAKIKSALKLGERINGVHLKQGMSMIIK